MDLQCGAVLQMVGRLLGETTGFGLRAGTVDVHGMEGCWPSKSGCFQCLVPKPEGNANAS